MSSDTCPNIGVTVSEVDKRFWSKVSKDGPLMLGLLSPCWEWTGAYDNQGYPRFKLDGKAMYANRARFLLEGTTLETHQQIVTLCYDKRCVRPEHHTIGNDNDSKTVSIGGRMGPGDQYVLRDMIRTGQMDFNDVAMMYGINKGVAKAVLMPVLPDIIKENLRILICGYNPGPQSARSGHYFSNPKHRFWKVLQEFGFTPSTLKPEEDRELLFYGIGLTDFMKNSVHGDDAKPTDWDRDQLRGLVLRYKPKLLVFLGRMPAIGFLGKNPGWGISNLTVGETQIAMVPDPSPANGHFNALKDAWLALSKVRPG